MRFPGQNKKGQQNVAFFGSGRRFGLHLLRLMGRFDNGFFQRNLFGQLFVGKDFATVAGFALPVGNVAILRAGSRFGGHCIGECMIARIAAVIRSLFVVGFVCGFYLHIERGGLPFLKRFALVHRPVQIPAIRQRRTVIFLVERCAAQISTDQIAIVLLVGNLLGIGSILHDAAAPFVLHANADSSNAVGFKPVAILPTHAEPAGMCFAPCAAVRDGNVRFGRCKRSRRQHCHCQNATQQSFPNPFLHEKCLL